MAVKVKYLTVLVLCCFISSKPFHTETVLAHKKEKPKNVLESSVRVNHRLSGASCGVIISAQKHKQGVDVTVISTGHMKDRTETEVELFYLDGKRLKEPLYAKGQMCLLVENNIDKGIDFCVIRATFDTKGEVAYTPLAPPSYTLKKGQKLLSVGCDCGIEPKLFDMEFIRYCKDRGDMHLKGECKAGRSGGGLFTADGRNVVGVCWGGFCNSPTTIFTSHKTIVTLMKQCGFE